MIQQDTTLSNGVVLLGVLHKAPHNKPCIKGGNIPTYSTILRELDIPIINPKKRDICYSKLVNLNNSSEILIITQNLKGFTKSKNTLIFLRYRDATHFLKIKPLSHKSERIGGFCV